MEELVRILHDGEHSLVVSKCGCVRTFNERGVKDLYVLYTTEPDALKGADVADKVVGKGAAALMILGGVRRLHTDVISRPALELFAVSGVEVSYDILTDGILNRAGTGPCPVEARCLPCASPMECFQQIENFLSQLR